MDARPAHNMLGDRGKQVSIASQISSTEHLLHKRTAISSQNTEHTRRSSEEKKNSIRLSRLRSSGPMLRPHNTPATTWGQLIPRVAEGYRNAFMKHMVT
eukprot:scaffold337409_cov17-Prasinocladus_malaysianus.AAC.1